MLSEEQLFQNWSLSSASSVFTFEEYRRLIGYHQLTGGDDWRKTQEDRDLEQRYQAILAEQKRESKRLQEQQRQWALEQEREREWREQYRRQQEQQRQRQFEIDCITELATAEILAERALAPKKRYLGEDEIYGSGWDGYPAIDLVQLRHARMGPEADPEDDNPYQEAARRLYDLESIAC